MARAFKKPFKPQAAMDFYKDMSTERILQIQSRAYAVLGEKARPMLANIVDTEFVKNVRDAQEAMGIGPNGRDGKWKPANDGRYEKFADAAVRDRETTWLTYYSMPAEEPKEPKLLAIPKKTATPDIEAKVRGTYRLIFRTPDNYFVVFGSNKPFKEIKKREIPHLCARAVMKGSVYDSDGTKVKLGRYGLEMFIDKHDVYIFDKQEKIARR